MADESVLDVSTLRPAELTRRSNDVLRALVWWIPGCLVFFRYAFTSGFDKIFGDDGDARLAVFLHEHWAQVLRRQVSWTSPEFFYPVKGTLGYSDTHILNEVFYLPLRVLGLDPYLAFQWTLILLNVVGFVSLFVFLRRTLELGTTTCAALATAFAFANNLHVKAGHTQLYAVYWLPVLLLLTLAATRAESRQARLAWGSVAGAFLGLLFYSTFYIAWFAVLGTLLVVTTLGILRLAAGRLGETIRSLRRHWTAAVGATVGFSLSMIPFAITYVPTLRSTGGRTYDQAMLYAAQPSDIFNLGGSNYLWGSLMREAISPERLSNGEVSLGLTPFLLGATLIGCAYVSLNARATQTRFAAEACVACGITIACLLLLPVKSWWGSLWSIPWTLLPGAKAIRAIDRLVLIGGLFAVISIGIAIKTLRDRPVTSRRARRVQTIGVATLLSLIVFEQLNLSNTSHVDRSEQLKALITAPEPPESCKAFYIVETVNPVPFYIASIDAMLISQHFGIPTVNGYSGHYPYHQGFDLEDPGRSGYVDSVHAWAERQGVNTGLCSYDRTRQQWSSVSV